MPLAPPVIKIVLLVSFIIKYPAPIKDARFLSTLDTIDRTGAHYTLWLSSLARRPTDSRNSRVVPTRRRFPSRLRQAEPRSRTARPGRDWRCRVVRTRPSPQAPLRSPRRCPATLPQPPRPFPQATTSGLSSLAAPSLL